VNDIDNDIDDDLVFVRVNVGKYSLRDTDFVGDVSEVVIDGDKSFVIDDVGV
jgi:hypothetical protein